MDPRLIPHVDHVQPVSTDDEPVLRELRDVLARHGALHRFGIVLLHQHFDMADDEIMLESCDPVTRTLTSRPIRKADADAATLLETNWVLNPQSDRSALLPLKACQGFCQRVQGHKAIHSA